ncbi:hypothetical protein ACFLRB_03780 [Acidobacteriota bacterium]
MIAEKMIRARLSLSVRDRELSENYAHELINFGFKIIKISPRGISFAGDIKLYEKIFNSKIVETSEGMRFREEPDIPEGIKKHMDSIYFPTKPKFF